MRKFFPVDSLARDSRFNQITMKQSQADPRIKKKQSMCKKKDFVHG